MRISGNTILVTGGTAGIGLAMAELLAAKDNQIIVCGRDEQRLADIKRHLPQVHTKLCDLRDARQVQTLAEEVLREFPALNILVNNAGIQQSVDLTRGIGLGEKICDEVGVNLIAPMILVSALASHLMKQDNAAVVNVTSALAVAPKASTPVYCASKAGLHNFTRTLRYQLHGSRVKVFELIPDLVDTSMTAGRDEGKKMSPQKLAKDFVKGLANNDYTMLTGRVPILIVIARIFPALAYRILRDQ